MPDPIVLDPNVQAPPAGGDPTKSSSPSEPWSKGLFADDGTINHKAFEKAPDDFKPLGKALERYKTADDFFKGYKEREGLLGKKGLMEPLPEKATDAEKAEHLALLRKVNGAPDKPEGYGIQRPADVPEAAWDQKYADQIQKIAYEEGISPSALKKLADAEIQYSKQSMEFNKQQAAAWEAGQDKLIREISGKEGLEYGKAKDLAERAGRKLGIDPTNEVMKNASVFAALMRAGRMMSEDELISGDTKGLGVMANMNAEQAEKAYKDIMGNKDNPDYVIYWNRDKKQNPDRVEQMRAKVRALQSLAHKA